MVRVTRRATTPVGKLSTPPEFVLSHFQHLAEDTKFPAPFGQPLSRPPVPLHMACGNRPPIPNAPQI